MSVLKTLTINGTTYNVTPVVPASSVTLLASAWVGEGELHSQMVEIPGVTPRTKVDLQPTPEQLEEFHFKVLAFSAENDEGTVTVYAVGDRPMNDHTIQITMTEVEGTGKVRGNTVGTTMPRPDWEQDDPTKADYIANKPDMDKFQKQIEEAEAIAKGRATGYVFDTIDDLDAWLADPTNTANLVLGDNLYIRATNVPDYWWDGEQKQILETQKVDLSEYAKSADVVQKYKKTSGRYALQHIAPNADGGTYGVTELSYSGSIPSGYAIPIGDGVGRVAVADPTEGKHAATKKYVDEQIVVKSRTKDGLKQVYTDNASDNNNRSSLIVDEHGNIVLEPLNERDGVATDADGDPIKSELFGVNNFVKGRGNKVDTTAEDTDTAKHGGAVVMGDLNTVTKPISTTFGYENTNDGGGAAFICGNNNTVRGFGAYAEGGNNTVNGNFAHAENDSNEASGRSSHAGGVGSVASHENTFVHGYHLQTGADNQFVVGKNNIANKTSLFVVGNGTATNDRRNAFWVNQNGDVYCNGKLTDQVYGRTLARYRNSETSSGASDKIPATCNAPGIVGEFVVGVGAGYLYICVGENSWVRVPLATNQNW